MSDTNKEDWQKQSQELLAQQDIASVSIPGIESLLSPETQEAIDHIIKTQSEKMAKFYEDLASIKTYSPLSTISHLNPFLQQKKIDATSKAKEETVEEETVDEEDPTLPTDIASIHVVMHGQGTTIEIASLQDDHISQTVEWDGDTDDEFLSELVDALINIYDQIQMDLARTK